MNIFSKIVSYLQGRTTAFLIAFYLSGNVMHWFHRLDANYITYMGVLMGYVLGHSIKEDLHPPDDAGAK